MLGDDDIAKLCHGRIIKANVYKSSGRDAAGPHYAVILDSDDTVKEHDSYFTAVISHDLTIDSQFALPVPPHTGLTGFVQCGWIEQVDLAGIQKVGPKVLPPDMAKILDMARRARLSKAAQKAKETKERPTQS